MIRMKGKLRKILTIAVILLLALIYVFPLLVMITTSFKTYNEAFDRTIGLFPKAFYLGNYIDVFNTIPFFKYLGNTLWITLMNVLGTVIVTPMIAYSLSKVKWSGRNIIFSIITATMMIPYTAIMIPLYRMWVKIGLTGSFWPLIIPAFFGAPLYIISFMYTFSDFLGPLLYANKGELYTLSLGLYAFLNEHSINWTSLMAAATIFMIPILIIFLIGQKQFVEGISTSGLKG